jgi:hypothetical protein
MSWPKSSKEDHSRAGSRGRLGTRISADDWPPTPLRPSMPATLGSNRVPERLVE